MLIPPGATLFDADGDVVAELPDRELHPDEVARYQSPVPVLFGHYWWQRDAPGALGPMAACLDFSVARHGDLAAYRWDSGATGLEPDRLVFS